MKYLQLKTWTKGLKKRKKVEWKKGLKEQAKKSKEREINVLVEG